MSLGKKVVIRIDATSKIGSGHAMRCIAIAQGVEEIGGEVRFAVSCDESASFLLSRGYAAEVLGGDPMRLCGTDADALGAYCQASGADALFIDTYGVTEAFFDGLRGLRDAGVRLGYLDDLYTFELGITAAPVHREVDLVLNYSLYADDAAYAGSYARCGADLLLGPAYAPLRREFWEPADRGCRDDVRDVLVTTGATNPGRSLERFASLAREAFPSADIHVVVGSSAVFEGPADGLDLLGPQGSLLPLMRGCDVCVTAAGTTLYELSAVGVPSAAVAVVDNQVGNAAAFQRLGLGFGHRADEPDEVLLDGLRRLRDPRERRRLVESMHGMVRGDGAMRVARRLLWN